MLYTDTLQASLLALPQPRRVGVLAAMLQLAEGALPRQHLPYNGVRHEYGDLIRVHRLEGGGLLLLWAVRLRLVEGGWSQVLQVGGGARCR